MMDTPRDAHNDGGAMRGSAGASGSVYAKLSATETTAQVPFYPTDADADGSSNANTVTSSASDADEHAQGSGEDGDGVLFGDYENANADDDDDDDEYQPPSDEEDADTDTDEENDLEDEDSSMRSLLQPLATLAKQFLLRRDQDDSEFDVHDAQLWDSPEEKRAWIECFERTNRVYEETYGCRIDSSSMPEVKRRLHHEKRREIRYTLVLLAIAAAYLARLWMTPTLSALPVAYERIQEVQAGLENVTGGWTQDTAGRLLEWPQAAWSSMTESVAESLRSWRQATTGSVKHASKNTSTEYEKETPPTVDSIATDESKTHFQVAGPDARAEATDKDTATTTNEAAMSTSTEIDVLTSDVHQRGQDISLEVKTVSDTVYGEASSVSETPVYVKEELLSVDIQYHSSAETDDEAIEGITVETTVDVMSTETHALVTDAPDPDGSTDVAVDQVSITHEEAEEGIVERTETLAVKQDAAVDVAIHRCSEVFAKLIKAKHDADLKAESLLICNKAVEVSQGLGSSTDLAEALVLRGDLGSLLLQVGDARTDYEDARSLLGRSEGDRGVIELKILANHWVDLYQRKNFSQLRMECQEAHEAEKSSQVKDLASEWLRAFKRESTVLHVLTKTRAWTLFRLRRTVIDDGIVSP